MGGSEAATTPAAHCRGGPCTDWRPAWRVTDTPRCIAEAREAASEGGRTPWKRGCGGAGAGACAQGKSPGAGLSGTVGVTGMFHVELPCPGGKRAGGCAMLDPADGDPVTEPEV